MANHTPVEDDPKQLEHAEYLWATFTQGSKWSIIAVAVILLIMAFVFVPSGA